jgi:hypothetical protein
MQIRFEEIPSERVSLMITEQRPVVKDALEDDDFAKPIIELNNQVKLFEKMQSEQ